MTQSQHASLIHMRSAKHQYAIAMRYARKGQHDDASLHMILSWTQLLWAAASAAGDAPTH